MKKQHKGFRIGALLLILIMLFSLWSPSIFATEDEGQLGEELETVKDLEEVIDEEEVINEEGAEEEELPVPVEEPVDGEKQESPSKEENKGNNVKQNNEGEDKKEEIKYYPSSGKFNPGPLIGGSMMGPSMMMTTNSMEEDYVPPVEGLTLTKDALVHSAGSDGRQIFRLDLTATTESIIETHSKPSDIVLVLDRSGSMSEKIYDYKAITSNPSSSGTYYIKIGSDYQKINHYSGTTWRYGSWGNRRYVKWNPNASDGGGSTSSSNPTPRPFYTRTEKTRMAALKESAKNFVDSVRDNSPESKIAIVSFASNHDGAEEVTTNRVMTDLTSGSNATSIKDAINGLSAKGGTHTDAGLKRGKEILNAITYNPDRGRVVILFTDGEPGTSGFKSYLLDAQNGYRHAAAAINQAAVIKAPKSTNNVTSDVTFLQGATYSSKAGTDTTGSVSGETGLGATLYTIGVFDTGVNRNLVDPFMTWVSSHKPYVSSSNYNSVPSPTNPNRPNGYYFTADSSDSLESIFQSISSEIGETLEGVKVKDYINPVFDIVDSDGNKLDVGHPITIDGVTGTIKQDGGGIYVEWTKDKIEPGTIEDEKGFKGSLYIKPKEDFIGGNNISSNIPNISAIYSNNVNVGSFPYPLVNVPFKLNIVDREDTIFLGEGIPKSPLEARNEMVLEELEVYDYPSGMLSFSWDNTFAQNEKLSEDSEYKLTISATPTDYVDTAGNPLYHTAVGTIVLEGLPLEATYKIYVVHGTLTITKNIVAGTGTHDPDQTFVFEIKQYSDIDKTNLIKTFYETIRVDNNSNNKIFTNLPKGYYEVKEKTDWSWQYEPVGNTSASGTLGMDIEGERDIEKTEVNASFTNKPQKTKWLTSIDWIVNVFTGGGN